MTFRSSPPSEPNELMAQGSIASVAPGRVGGAEVTIFDTIPGTVRFGAWNEIMFVAWETSADGNSVARLNEHARMYQSTHPGQRQSGVHIVREGVGLPTPEARAGLMEMMKSQADRFGAVAVVIYGTGFVASAVRSFLTGLRIVAPRTFDFRLHGKSSEVLKWFPAAHLARTGHSVDPIRLGRVLAAFETSLDWK